MDSVSKLRRSAQFVVGIFSVWAVLLLTACGPELGKIPDSVGIDPTKADPATPEAPGPVPPETPPDEPPEASVPLVRALWEKPNPVAGPSWTSYAFAVVRDYGSSLLAGTNDVTNFCPAYHSLNQDQKISFWVYLVSAITKYESGFSPVNRYKETSMGVDPVTKEAVWSEGLLQLSYQDSLNYKFCNEFDWSKDKLLSRADPRKTILDPFKNLQCGIRIMNQIMGRHQAIAYGSGHYWAVLKTSYKKNKVREIQMLTNQVLFCRR